MKILLDTNFLIYCVKEKIDYIEELRTLIKGEYELIVLDQVIEELQRLSKKAKKYSDKQASELALKLLRLNKIRTIKGLGKNADDSMIKKSKGNIIATVDLDLARQLERTIVVRGRRKLVFR